MRFECDAYTPQLPYPLRHSHWQLVRHLVSFFSVICSILRKCEWHWALKRFTHHFGVTKISTKGEGRERYMRVKNWWNAKKKDQTSYGKLKLMICPKKSTHRWAWQLPASQPAEAQTLALYLHTCICISGALDELFASEYPVCAVSEMK